MFLDTALHEKVKRMADDVYKKPSAYKSGYIIKMYKSLGGRFKDTEGKLKQWFQEDWKDIGNKAYPVYRPTKRVNASTPLTPKEISPANLKKQIALKQKIKGANLPAFVKR